MNENIINLTRILKNCPRGTKFYSPVYGWVTFSEADDSNIDYEEIIIYHNYGRVRLDKFGVLFDFRGSGECILLPSKDQRDWSKFTAPWLKKERFDPKTLQPFDKVLAASMADGRWVCDFFSHIGESIRDGGRLYVGTGFGAYDRMIPYNEETKHLVGTKKEAPEYYRYWEG